MAAVDNRKKSLRSCFISLDFELRVINELVLYLAHTQYLQRVLVVALLQHFIGKIKPVDHPTPVLVVTLRRVKMSVVGSEEPVIHAVRLAIRPCVRPTKSAILVPDHELTGRIRL